MIELHNAECFDKLRELEDNSVDSVVTDPPYFLSFMGKDWDKLDGNIAANVEFWKEVLRVLKPGGHLLAFGHSRTHHRLYIAIEDAGFEIRDTIMWLYGSGFPKSHNISIGIDKAAKAMSHRGQRVSIAGNRNYGGEDLPNAVSMPAHKPITDEAKKWEGWGTALKPAHEPICLARKPLEGTVATNILKHGVGGLNIDESRVATSKEDVFGGGSKGTSGFAAGYEGDGFVNGSELGRWPANVLLDEEAGEILNEQSGISKSSKRSSKYNKKTEDRNGYTPEASDYRDDNTYADTGGASRFFHRVEIEQGRWPANIILDEEAGEILDSQAPKVGSLFKATRKVKTSGGSGDSWTNGGKEVGEDNGLYDGLAGASRFFYCAKVSKSERNAGCEEITAKASDLNSGGLGRKTSVAKRKDTNGVNAPTMNNRHPTVKPKALMSYLIKLITPPGGKVLDPFMGSGSTGLAAKEEGFSFIGIEREQEYFEIAKARIGE